MDMPPALCMKALWICPQIKKVFPRGIIEGVRIAGTSDMRLAAIMELKLRAIATVWAGN